VLDLSLYLVWMDLIQGLDLWETGVEPVVAKRFGVTVE